MASSTNNPFGGRTPSPSKQLLGPLHSPANDEESFLPAHPYVEDNDNDDNSSNDVNDSSDAEILSEAYTTVARGDRQTGLNRYPHERTTAGPPETPTLHGISGRVAALVKYEAPKPPKDEKKPAPKAEQPDAKQPTIKPGYVCQPFKLALKENDVSSAVDIFHNLQKTIGASNTDIDRQITAYFEKRVANNPDLTIAVCVDRHFELLRHWIEKAAESFDKLDEENEVIRQSLRTARLNLTQVENNQQTLQQNPNRIKELDEEVRHLRRKISRQEDAINQKDEENTRLLQVIQHLSTKAVGSEQITPQDPSNSPPPPGSPINQMRVDITVPKALRTPLAAHPIPIFNGGGDIEATFEFIRAIDHHRRLLQDDFDDKQRIKYATSYLEGAVLQWAMEEWPTIAVTANTPPSWDAFFDAFKARWVSENAHVYLTHKLDKMELKGNQIDQFNHNFATTMALLGKKDLTMLSESDQYYQIYARKIRDPTILLAIQQISFSLSVSGGLNLSMLMKYTARLMATKLANGPRSTTANPSTTAPLNAAAPKAHRNDRNNRNDKSKRHSLNNTEE